MKTVLVATDFSRISKRVIDEGVALAQATNARLVLLHVVQLPDVLGSGVRESDLPSGFYFGVEKRARARLAKLQKELRERGVAAHAIHQVGPPGQRIVEQAERLEADYIVLGSHGHGAIYELLVGSATSHVLKHASCRVMVISPRVKRMPKAATSDAASRLTPAEV